MSAEVTLRVVVASVPDRAGLVGEVWAGDDHICEVSIRSGKTFVEIYPRRDGGPWALDYGAFMAAVEKAAEGATGPPEADGTDEGQKVEG